MKQIMNNFFELGIPLFKIVIKLYLSKRKRGPEEEKDHGGLMKKMTATTPWGRDYQLAPEIRLFWEYLELGLSS